MTSIYYYFRVDNFILPSGITQLISHSLEQSKAKALPMKFILYCGQIISREFKEKMTEKFQGTPFVSLYTD